MDAWSALADILILLTVAMLLGGLCERFRQSSLVGYLLAGTLLGPNALNLVANAETIAAIAELGVALLLFTIGLEFTFQRLRAVGPVAVGGGTLQILVTGGLTTAVSLALGLGVPASVAVGGMVALSSTAAVARLLAARTEIESVHGRSAIGVLLMQDVAVVPLALIVAALAGGEAGERMGTALLRASGLALGLIVALRLVLNYVLPQLLSTRIASLNRDLSILMAVVTAVGAAWASHALGLSPVLGSFIAGLMLADSPYATQIRADIGSLRALFVTLFFSAIGMLADPGWVVGNLGLVAAAVAVVVGGKALIAAAAVSPFHIPPGQALATGMVLAQVGEFSLVLATIAEQGGVIGPRLFDLMVAVLIVTLFLTPYLVAGAPRVAHWVASRSGSGGGPLGVDELDERPWGRHLVIVGFGPAGKRVAELEMAEPDLRMIVIDMNPRSLEQAEDYDLATVQGDATSPEVLERAHVASALAVVVTIPDPGAARQIVLQVRAMAPNAKVIVRSRYHVHRWVLEMAGAHAVVDEENVVGVRIAETLHGWLEERRGARP